ncbi:glycosyltransferase [Tumidithrix elongata]
MTTFSLLLPTCDRVELVYRFFQSLVDTTENLKEIEIILAIDEDDLASQDIIHNELQLKKVILPKGSTMGNLNRACFEASCGRYVMLVNDDIIVRTKGWDRAIADVLTRFEDDVVLIHVNDLLFREKLPTFPMLSRKSCLEIGICAPEYQRYRIDDHIYEIYNLLAYLGYKRIVYLPDVIFEHDNYALRESLDPQQKLQSQVFKSTDHKVYLPNQQIIDKDEQFFQSTFEQRKIDALKLINLIDSHRMHQQQIVHESLLRDLRDSFSYRKPQFIGQVNTSSSDRVEVKDKVTIAVVTSSIYKPHARRCLAQLKRYTNDFELIILDNNGTKDFNHSREINKVLDIVKTDFLVIMDDDVFVEDGWLQGLLKSVDDRTGVVAPMHKDRRGRISFSGVYLKGDGLGTHAHLTDLPNQPRVCQCLCSALLLIDMRKCREIRFNDKYKKYFLDLDYSLKVWEAGHQIICTPYTTVTHIGGATLPYRSAKADLLFDRDSQIFIENWISSGRLAKIEAEIWRQFMDLYLAVEIPQRISRVLDTNEVFKQDSANILNHVTKLIKDSKPFSLFEEMLAKQLVKCILLSEDRGMIEKVKLFESLLSLLEPRFQLELTMKRLDIQKEHLSQNSNSIQLLSYYLTRAYCIYRMYGKRSLLGLVMGFLRLRQA